VLKIYVRFTFFFFVLLFVPQMALAQPTTSVFSYPVEIRPPIWEAIESSSITTTPAPMDTVLLIQIIIRSLLLHVPVHGCMAMTVLTSIEALEILIVMTPFIAAGIGTVVFAQVSSGWGKLVRIRHNTPEGVRYTLYAHLNSMLVSVGQEVVRGQQIGGDWKYWYGIVPPPFWSSDCRRKW
jgi:hypothetical protein